MVVGRKLTVRVLSGPALADLLPEVARLRIEVFREWPYLYEGSLDYEQRYLASFAEAKHGLVVAAFDGSTIVGAATAAPLAQHTAEFARLFAAHGLDPDRVFYCGESVLLARYRGAGAGHMFFDLREQHARAVTGPKGAYTHMAFCGVVRRLDDPRTPAGYHPLDDFWRRRGYAPVDGLVGTYSWTEIGDRQETPKPMQFWMKAL